MVEWKDGATASSAADAQYWLAAEANLQLGVRIDSDTQGYQRAISELAQLALLPAADLTSVQDTEFRTDVSGLDAFFNTPALYQ